MNQKLLCTARKILLPALLICIIIASTGCGQSKEPSDTQVTLSSETDGASSETEGSSSDVDTSSETEDSSNDSDISSELETEFALNVNDIAFIGDSRTLSMASGGRLAYNLIPSSSVFATWGGKLTDDSTKVNAQNAATSNKKIAVFWYGINDVQGNPATRDDASLFCSNYEAIIDLYRSSNPDSDIVILSILTTSIYERDYYDKQEENIRAYNAKLASLCKEKGYTYLDLTSLYTGDECFAEGDYIHFSKKWYENSFIPNVFEALEITDIQ